MIDVLVVDDDDAYGDLSKERLEEAGLNVVFHHGPFGTMNKVIELSPRVVVLDINMPGLCGTKLLDMLASSMDLEKPPQTLLMSSCDENKLRELACKHGAAASLSKSTPRQDFIRTVKDLLTQSGKQVIGKGRN